MAVNQFELPYSVKITNPKPVDYFYGPYLTIAAAKAAIPLVSRYDGMTVKINGTSIEYWWEATDLSDSGLKPKYVIGGAGITDITYSALTTAITGSTLAKGSWYRITDFATVHNILTSSPNVVNTGSTEPLIVFATGLNTLAEQVFSEQYPQDVIRYEVSNTKVAGATKGVILFRHDTDKNISCFYDWRNVKFRDYDGLWQNSNVTINSDKTIAPGTAVDVLTFFDSATPANVENVSIGLRTENNRLNNIVFISASGGSYARSIKRVRIDNNCYNMRFGKSTVSQVHILQLEIKNNCFNIKTTDVTRGSSSSRVSGIIGANSRNIYLASPIISNDPDNPNFNPGTLIIGENCKGINIPNGFANSVIGNNCSDITTSNSGNDFEGFVNSSIGHNCSNIRMYLISLGGFTNVHFKESISNKIFDTSFVSLINCVFLAPNSTSKTYSNANSDLVFDKVDSAGDWWATSISTGGVISQIKMT